MPVRGGTHVPADHVSDGVADHLGADNCWAESKSDPGSDFAAIHPAAEFAADRNSEAIADTDTCAVAGETNSAACHNLH